MGGLPNVGAVVCSGRYRLRRLLGAGDRKRVFLAHDERLGRDVAMSIVEVEGRFSRDLSTTDWEVRVTAKLGDHPHIVGIYDTGTTEDGRAYLVAQLMRGGTLGEFAERCCETGDGLPLDDVIRVGRELCMGLAHVHDNQFLHRDLHPRNVWLDAAGSAHLGDFDDAIPLDRPHSAGDLVTTAPYRPPEQVLGEYLDTRSDLYSLGASLYELAAGRPPFEGTEEQLNLKHVSEEPDPPSAFRAGIPKALDELVVALLAKDRTERPESAEAVLEALDRIGEDLHPVAEPGDLRDLIRQGESDRLEFKSSLRFPHGKPDLPPEARKSIARDLEETVAKVLASFLNARGGILLIGVRDDGEILGIEHDFATLGSKASLDGWEVHFKNVTSQLIGSSARTCTSTRFVAGDRGTVAVVRCSARAKPTWLYPNTDREAFWVRSGNANQRLSPSEASGYIQEHWGRNRVPN